VLILGPDLVSVRSRWLDGAVAKPNISHVSEKDPVSADLIPEHANSVRVVDRIGHFRDTEFGKRLEATGSAGIDIGATVSWWPTRNDPRFG
jgi:hypothetical protein